MNQLLVLCDSGGSNGARPWLWKYCLHQRLAQVHGLPVRVCHYPPGASKWNPVDHRLFSFISLNWAGVPLQSYELILKYIRTTTTQTGLTVDATRNRKRYDTGKKIGPQRHQQIAIQRDVILPQWNYTILPTLATDVHPSQFLRSPLANDTWVIPRGCRKLSLEYFARMCRDAILGKHRSLSTYVSVGNFAWAHSPIGRPPDLHVWLTRAKKPTDHNTVGPTCLRRSDPQVSIKAIRVYIGRTGSTLVVLLRGGVKQAQSRDIERARSYWTDYRRRS